MHRNLHRLHLGMNAKIGAATVVALLLAGGGGLAYFEWRQHQLPSSALPHVKNVTLRLTNSLGYELTPSNVTYGELLESIGKHITEIDSKIIDLQTLENSKNRAAVEPTLEYMRGVQEVLRAQQMLYRKQMQVASSTESLKQAFSELQNANYYGYAYAKRSVDRAEEEASNAATEYDDARRTFRVSLESLVKARAKVEQVVPNDMLCDPTLPAKVIAKAAKEPAA